MNSESLWGREGFLGGEKRLFTCIFQAVPFTGRANNDHPTWQKGKCHVFLSHDGGVDIPADVYRENGELMISIFAPEGGVAWEYPLDDWLRAIERAVELLDGG